MYTFTHFKKRQKTNTTLFYTRTHTYTNTRMCRYKSVVLILDF